ncbi:hypothetical protein F4703DRAFT_1886724 [Phycomyces blakesleeanus]
MLGLHCMSVYCTCAWCVTIPKIANLPGSLARRNQCLVVEFFLHSIVGCISHFEILSQTVDCILFICLRILFEKKLRELLLMLFLQLKLLKVNFVGV